MAMCPKNSSFHDPLSRTASLVVTLRLSRAMSTRPSRKGGVMLLPAIRPLVEY